MAEEMVMDSNGLIQNDERIKWQPTVTFKRYRGLFSQGDTSTDQKTHRNHDPRVTTDDKRHEASPRFANTRWTQMVLGAVGGVSSIRNCICSQDHLRPDDSMPDKTGGALQFLMLDTPPTAKHPPHHGISYRKFPRI
jgi:hypothetical protein